MKEFGQRLRTRRLELGMTAGELAEKLGKHRTTVLRYETGEIDAITAKTVKAIAMLLAVSPAWLLGWEKEMPRSVGAEPRRVLKGRNIKHRASISRTAETVKGLCAGNLSYDEMVEVVRPVYPGMDKPLLSKAMNTEKYGVTLTQTAAEAILSAAERKQNGDS